MRIRSKTRIALRAAVLVVAASLTAGCAALAPEAPAQPAAARGNLHAEDHGDPDHDHGAHDHDDGHDHDEAHDHAGSTTDAEPTRTFVLRAVLSGFVGEGGDVDGVENPTLRATVGDVLRVRIVNGDGLEHDLVVPELRAHTPHVVAEGEEAQTTFEATTRGAFSYFCSVPGHRGAGMEGVLVVSE